VTQDVTGTFRLDWTEAEIHPMVAGGFMLVVRGVAPTPVEVELRPRPLGIAPDDYRGIEVLAHQVEPVTQVETPWVIERDVDDIPKGKIGFVLLGETMRAYFPPKE
jgi:hypothetical protein